MLDEGHIDENTGENLPLASFCLTVYNQERYIKAALDAAFAQTYRPLEIVISDDASTDATAELIEQAIAEREARGGDIPVIFNRAKENVGNLRNWLRFGELAHGEILVKADGDDISMPERTAKIVEAWLATGKRAKVVSHRARKIDADGMPLGDFRRIDADSPLGAAQAFVRECWTSFPPFPEIDTVRQVYDDNVFCPRAQMLGGDECETVIDDFLIEYRFGAGLSTMKLGMEYRKPLVKDSLYVRNSMRAALMELETMRGKIPDERYARLKEKFARKAEFHDAQMQFIGGASIWQRFKGLRRLGGMKYLFQRHKYRLSILYFLTLLPPAAVDWYLDLHETRKVKRMKGHVTENGMGSKIKHVVAGAVAALALAAAAQVVERPRPAGWNRLVEGGRFKDRFEVADVIGNGWTDKCWGGDNVKPRDVRNGIEDAEYSYWGGNIKEIDGKWHLFVARWKESEPKGHMFWPNSEIAHAVSNKPNGDFKVVEVLGKGHNPEIFRCKDDSWAVYCIDSKGLAHVYRAQTVAGPWTYARMELDLAGKKPLEGESNFSFCTRPDGSVLAVCRGGGIWLSEDGIKPFVRMSEGSVYPNVAGRFEDPVLWRDEVQYHIVVNDWLGRVAWKLTSPDGFAWTTQPGEAYTPGIANVRSPDGDTISNDWFKYERMRVVQDRYGRVVQANFAVIDCVKRDDKGGDIHSSKNITIPVNPGRRIETFKRTHKGWEARIRSEKGFDSLADVDVDSLILGPQSMVAFGAGVRAIGTAEAAGDLVAIFPPVELGTPVVEILGREKNGRLFFATARMDGTKLEMPRL
ncbi:MAG: glycosyltransferase [Kiritimatiellae bacterium]|nr:glycosyltransferase [Kiritimatiellia bacterium]